MACGGAFSLGKTHIRGASVQNTKFREIPWNSVGNFVRGQLESNWRPIGVQLELADFPGAVEASQRQLGPNWSPVGVHLDVQWTYKSEQEYNELEQNILTVARTLMGVLVQGKQRHEAAPPPFQPGRDLGDWRSPLSHIHI